MKRLTIIALLVLSALSAQAQHHHGGWALGTVLDGDTIPRYLLREVHVEASSRLLTPQEIRKNQKLIRNVRKMLPYARLAKSELDRVEREAANMSAKERKEYIKKQEKLVFDQYYDELNACTVAQGKVLIKLIDRETSRTPYTLVVELRNKVRAGFYQAFGRIFGLNLKNHYDPRHNKEDNLIERIVLSLDCGQL